jgi:hypothetical protein
MYSTIIENAFKILSEKNLGQKADSFKDEIDEILEDEKCHFEFDDFKGSVILTGNTKYARLERCQERIRDAYNMMQNVVNAFHGKIFAGHWKDDGEFM